MKHDNFEHHSFPTKYSNCILNVNGNKVHVKDVVKETKTTKTGKTYSIYRNSHHHVFSVRELKNGQKKLYVYHINNNRIMDVTQNMYDSMLDKMDEETNHLLATKVAGMLNDAGERPTQGSFSEYYYEQVFRNPVIPASNIDRTQNIHPKFLGTHNVEELLVKFLHKKHQTDELKKYAESLPPCELVLFVTFGNILTPERIRAIYSRKTSLAKVDSGWKDLNFLMSKTFVETVRKMDSLSAERTLRFALDETKRGTLLIPNKEWFAFMSKTISSIKNVDEAKYVQLQSKPQTGASKKEVLKELMRRSLEDNEVGYLYSAFEENMYLVLDEYISRRTSMNEKTFRYMKTPCLTDGLADVVRQKKRKYERFLISHKIPVTEQNIKIMFCVDLGIVDEFQVLFTKKMWKDFLSMMRKGNSMTVIKLYRSKDITLTEARSYEGMPQEWVDVMVKKLRASVTKPINRKEMFALGKR